MASIVFPNTTTPKCFGESIDMALEPSSGGNSHKNNNDDDVVDTTAGLPLCNESVAATDVSTSSGTQATSSKVPLGDSDGESEAPYCPDCCCNDDPRKETYGTRQSTTDRTSKDRNNEDPNDDNKCDEPPLFQFLTGMKDDLRARAPYYWDDWSRPRNVFTVVNATVFTFVIQLIPALIFCRIDGPSN